MPRRERRVQLLESALEVFASQGYHAAAMDDIAERAGVSKPVLYQHFPSKMELYLALLDNACAAMVSGCAEALKSNSDNKFRVAAAVNLFFEFVTHDTAAYRLIFESDLTSDTEVTARVEQATLECANLIGDVIESDTGLPTASARLLAVSMVGMAQVSARYWLAEPSNLEQRQAVNLISGLAWRGISGYPLSDDVQHTTEDNSK
jgi:AcrR family transcriptional regulator